MNPDFVTAYQAIFEMEQDDFKLAGLKLLGPYEKQNSTGSNVYKFIAIITAPAALHELIPDQNELVELKGYFARKHDEIGGPAFAHTESWKKTVDVAGKKKEKTKTFEIRGEVNTATVLDWEIWNGKYYIQVEAWGVF